MVTAPGAPTGVSATADGNDNVITWTAPDSSSISGYHVRHRTGGRRVEQPLRERRGRGRLLHARGRRRGRDARVRGTSPQRGRERPVVRERLHHPSHPAHGTDRCECRPGRRRHRPDLDPPRLGARGRLHRPAPGRPRGRVHRERAAGGDRDLLHHPGHNVGDTVYRLQVRAHNADGDGPWSEAVELEKVLLPSAPTRVSAAADDTNITLNWAAPETGRVAGYHVSYGEASSEEHRSVDQQRGDRPPSSTQTALRARPTRTGYAPTTRQGTALGPNR